MVPVLKICLRIGSAHFAGQVRINSVSCLNKRGEKAIAENIFEGPGAGGENLNN
jgi:hypothetical protein